MICRAANQSDTDFALQSRGPDSDGIRSGCVRKVPMRDGEAAEARKVWERRGRAYLNNDSGAGR